MKSLDADDAFEGYMRKVNPDVAQHTPQYRESRRCFMAGMWQALQHMLWVSAEWPEADAMKEIAQLEDQLAQFKERVKQDKD
jgi:hypothetical protein